MSEAGLTVRSLAALEKIMTLEFNEQEWVFTSWMRGIDSASRQCLIAELGGSQAQLSSEADDAPSPFQQAKDRLLDDTSMPAGEKALLAAFIVRELYDVSNFTSRQVTETLRETGNTISNVSTALTGLVQKSLVKVVDTPTRGGSQKTYILTENGMKKARSISERPKLSF